MGDPASVWAFFGRSRSDRLTFRLCFTSHEVIDVNKIRSTTTAPPLRRPSSLLAAGLLLLVAAGFTACSDGENSNFEQVSFPELGVEDVDGRAISLVLPSREGDVAKQPVVTLKSTGVVPLTIESIEWIDRPDRLFMSYGIDDAITSCEECDSGLCDQAESRDFCHIVEEPGDQLPAELVPQALYALEFFTTGTGALDCPEPGDDVPENLREEYCGALRVTTNATNSTDVVDEGTFVLYFQAPQASGTLKITPSTTIIFEGIEPGDNETRQFTVENVGTQPLTVERIEVDSFQQFLQVTGEWPTTIEPGGNATYTINLVAPEQSPLEELDFSASVTVYSSDVRASQKINVVSRTAAAPAPQIELQQDRLRFDDGATKELVVANTGQATLLLTQVKVEPASAAKFYTVKDADGNELSGNIQLPVGKEDQTTLTIEFMRPDGNTEASLGRLVLGHNDDTVGSQSELVLMGDEGEVPFAELVPDAFAFPASATEPIERSFVIVNRGLAPLDVTNLDFNVKNMRDGGKFEDFVVSFGGQATTTVPAGGFVEGTVKYAPSDTTVDVVDATLVSNNPLGDLLLALRSSDLSGPPTGGIATSFTESARVGQKTTLSLVDPMPATAANSAQWFLVERPAASSLWVEGFGPEIAFVPDVAGTYRVAVMLFGSGLEHQEIVEFEAVP